MEISVDKWMYQYCQDLVLGGGQILLSGTRREKTRPLAKSNSKIRVMQKIDSTIMFMRNH